MEGAGSSAQRGDGALQALRALLTRGPFVEVDYQAVVDEQALIRSKLRLMTDGDEVDLVLSIGGVGIGVRDRVPEATVEVLEREIPGLAERMRWVAGREHPEMALTRGVVGVRHGVLVVNLPAAAAPAEAALASLLDLLPVALAEVRGGVA